MTLGNLDNLVKIEQLKQEPPDQKEFDGMIEAAKRSMQDAAVEGLSEEGKFTLLYGAAHVISLAAMRWHGYRSSNRHLVFKCLEHTLGLDSVKWRILDQCHQRRNIAEYEGNLEVSPQLMIELEEITNEIVSLVEQLGPVTGE